MALAVPLGKSMFAAIDENDRILSGPDHLILYSSREMVERLVAPCQEIHKRQRVKHVRIVKVKVLQIPNMEET